MENRDARLKLRGHRTLTLERRLFTLDWVSYPALRREIGQELNKGEARNSLARAIFIRRDP